jgi:hypothetical protein
VEKLADGKYRYTNQLGTVGRRLVLGLQSSWGIFILLLQMNQEQHAHPPEEPAVERALVVRPLSTLGFLFYILHGVGVTVGLCLFWILEVVRNNFFRLLDGLNLKARIRRASAFPPGQPRKRPLTEASR